MSDVVRERPILFSGPMVRAILAGRKTQTRRIIKPQPIENAFHKPETIDGYLSVGVDRVNENLDYLKKPYGKPGNRLWVREAFSTWHHGCHWRECTSKGRSKASCSNLFYRATHHFPDDDQKWVPSIFMPRWASRITLEVVSVRVERLQDISEADAIAEGVDFGKDANGNRFVPPLDITGLSSLKPCREAFRDLWQSINGPNSWDANPWVWVVEFKRIGASNE